MKSNGITTFNIPSKVSLPVSSPGITVSPFPGMTIFEPKYGQIILESFPGHKGRPGQKGGSSPEGTGGGTSTQTNLNVAKTIIQQFGGNKFAVMTGAKNFVGSADGVTFKIGRNSSPSNFVKVVLDPGSDTYNLVFSHIRKYQNIVDKEYKDVNAAQLRSIFEKHTGMRTSLGF